MCHIYVCFSKTILIELHILLRDFLFPDIFMFLVAGITEMFIIISNWQGFEYRKALVSKKKLTLYLIISMRLLLLFCCFVVCCRDFLRLCISWPSEPRAEFVDHGQRGGFVPAWVEILRSAVASRLFAGAAWQSHALCPSALRGKSCFFWGSAWWFSDYGI